ncbi:MULTISPECIES: hypothetical protein [unclassified Microcoleus]
MKVPNAFAAQFFRGMGAIALSVKQQEMGAIALGLKQAIERVLNR